MFASLEVDYEDADNDPTGEVAVKLQQTLTFYELDLGLNHVVRKYSEPLEEHANLLISVPGGSDGPSGVLVCSENYITYKNLGDQPDIRCPIPRRRVSHTYINYVEVKFVGQISYPPVNGTQTCKLFLMRLWFLSCWGML